MQMRATGACPNQFTHLGFVETLAIFKDKNWIQPKPVIMLYYMVLCCILIHVAVEAIMTS